MSKENWTTENIPDLKGQTAIVTGANTGLGRETAKSLGVWQPKRLLFNTSWWFY